MFDDSIFRLLQNGHTQNIRDKEEAIHITLNFKKFFFMQKVMGFNSQNVPWPVDFRSIIIGEHMIEKGIMCDPGDNIGAYINAHGGLKIGDNVAIGANTIITTTNHSIYDHRKKSDKKGVIIGNNVWIEAIAVFLQVLKLAIM